MSRRSLTLTLHLPNFSQRRRFNPAALHLPLLARHHHRQFHLKQHRHPALKYHLHCLLPQAHHHHIRQAYPRCHLAPSLQCHPLLSLFKLHNPTLHPRHPHLIHRPQALHHPLPVLPNRGTFGDKSRPQVKHSNISSHSQCVGPTLLADVLQVVAIQLMTWL